MAPEERRHSDELIHEMHGDLKAVSVKVCNLERYVMLGNGGKSLGERVRALENWHWLVKGGVAVMSGGLTLFLIRLIWEWMNGK